MEKKYSYQNGLGGGGEFTITRLDDCSIEITKDDCSVILCADKSSNMYRIAFSDELGPVEQKNCSARMAVGSACEMILNRERHETRYKELCFNLNEYYNSIEE